MSEEDTEARVIQAVIQKATRILMLAETPLGVFDEIGAAVVRPDYGTLELVKGLRYQGLDVDAVTAGVVEADVIRQGLQTDPANFPAERLPDVTRALAASKDWVASELVGIGVA